MLVNLNSQTLFIWQLHSVTTARSSALSPAVCPYANSYLLHVLDEFLFWKSMELTISTETELFIIFFLEFASKQHFI